MRVLVAPGIPYDTSGWRVEREGFTVRRAKGVPSSLSLVNKYDAVVNLGNGKFPDAPNTWNSSSIVQHCVSLSLYQNLVGGLVPPPPKEGQAYWVKKPGYHGQGKKFYEHFSPGHSFGGGIVQSHISGVEYRVITVGRFVVQVARKIPKKLSSGQPQVGVFDWEWIGVNAGGQILGLIPTAKAAAEIFVETFKTDQIILGHDIIRSDSSTKCYLIESNSAPGMNEFTAGRVLKQMKEIWSAN